MSRTLRHAGAAAFFLISSLIWSFPLITRISTHLPGDGLGDNAAFLWNFWWMRHALSTPGEHFFQTRQLFAPFGADLTLHTHTALPAFLGATILRPLSPVMAQNVVILAALWLNGFAAYLLAFDRTRDFPAAILAGLVFGGSPYLSLHLLGHFNLIHAWGLPLFALFLLRGLDAEFPVNAPTSRVRASGGTFALVAAGLVLVATAYTDYYYFIYCVVLGAVLIVGRAWPFGFIGPARRVPRALVAILLVVAAADAALIATIVFTGGFDTDIAGRAISVRSITNPLTVLWILALVYVCLARVSFGSVGHRPWRLPVVVTRLLPMILVVAAGVLPLAVGAVRLWRHGDYVTATPSWRSGPGGVDLATFLLGNPMTALTGGWTSALYVRLGIDRMEKTGWIGLVPVALAGWAAWRFFATPRTYEIRALTDLPPESPGSVLAWFRETGRWLGLGAVFGVWALGPWLMIAGKNAGLPLPQILFPYIPILSNARMPGRAMVVVMLAVAMLAALATRVLRRRWLMPVAIALIALDFVPAPFPTVAIARPTEVNAFLAAHPGGTVCPLPLGLRDGYGEIGRFDGRILLDQMTHGHPIAGGFVARLSPNLRSAYENSPMLGSLLRLSAGQSALEAEAAMPPSRRAEELRKLGIRYLVLDGRQASQALVDFVAALPLERLVATGDQELLRVSEE